MQNWSKRNGHCVKICEAQPWNASDGTFWSLAGKCACNFGLTRRRCTQQKPHWQHTSNILRRLNQLNQVAAIRLFDYLTIELLLVSRILHKEIRDVSCITAGTYYLQVCDSRSWALFGLLRLLRTGFLGSEQGNSARRQVVRETIQQKTKPSSLNFQSKELFSLGPCFWCFPCSEDLW